MVSTEQNAFQITYASITSRDGDPVAAAERILRDEQVLAALRESDGGEVTALIPVTESGSVVALDASGLLRFDLSTTQLQELFAAAGLTLGVTGDEMDTPALDEYDHALIAADESGQALFAPEPVRVAEFSRRGPWLARITAQILHVDVDYLEDGTWSLYRYATDRSHGALTDGRAAGAIVELNVPQHGDAWVEVTTPRGVTAMFWPNSERLTRPVLDFDAIGTPESAELYRRMLAEADGTHDELLELGSLIVDIEAAHRASLPEAIGGVEGTRERLATFVAAFGVPAALVSAALDGGGTARQFAARGWMPLIGEILTGGTAELTALTRRQKPFARLARALRERPLLGAALSTGELAVGAALTRSRSGLARTLGIFLVIDAIADLIIWVVRIRRR